MQHACLFLELMIPPRVVHFVYSNSNGMQRVVVIIHILGPDVMLVYGCDLYCQDLS